MENNNMITIRGFKMSGKFGEVALEELTLPCTKEALSILDNLADVTSGAADECLDTSELTETKTTTNDNGVKAIKECLTIESMQRIFDSFNMIPKSGSLTYKTKFKTDLDESVYVRVSFYPNVHASIWVTVDIYPNDQPLSIDLKAVIHQNETAYKLLDSEIGYMKTVIESLTITDTSWMSFKDKFLELLDSQNYRKFIGKV